MECITRGFHERNSKSTISGSISSHQKRFSILSNNLAEEKAQNIAPVFGEESLIERYLESVTVQNKKLVLLRSHKTLLRHDHGTLEDCVKLLSGGATTVDPIFSGSVGPGMLTGVVFGKFKKSPPSLSILEVLRVMSRKNSQGILVIVMNNLANRLNFGAACQSAAREGIKTLLVNVGEDVSGVSVSKTIGRRGLCGIKFLFKVAGAMSEEKRTLQEIHYTIEKLKGNCLGSLNVQIRPDMMVIGPGCKGDSENMVFLWNKVHENEENTRLSFIVNQALTHLFHQSSQFSLHVAKGDRIAIIVNNLGNLSDFYLSLVIKEIMDQIKSLGIIIMRIYSGRFLNLNLAGFSISVLKMKELKILELLDRPVDVTSWTQTASLVAIEPNIILDLPSISTPYTITPGDKRDVGPKFTEQEATHLLEVLPKVVETVQNMEEYLNKLDDDHDFGTAITKFANAIQTEIDTKSLKISTPHEFLAQMSYLAGFSMGGVAGGIFSILFSSAAQMFQGALPEASVDMAMWVEAARHARDSLQKFTRVQPGDGTIIDALDPFIEHTKEHSVRGLSKRVTAAVSGAEGTTTKRASIRGSRASARLSIRPLIEATREGNVTEVIPRAPDPGALCLASVIRTIFTTLQIELAEAEAKSPPPPEIEPSIYEEGDDQKQLSRLRKENVKQGTKLHGEESKPLSRLKGEGSVHVTISREQESERAENAEEEGSKHSSKLEDKKSKHSSKLGDKGSKHSSKLEDKGSKHSSKLGDKRSKHSSKLEDKRSKHSSKLEDKRSKHSSKLEDKRSKQSTTLDGGEINLDTTLQEEETNLDTELNEVELKNDTEMKGGDSKHITILQAEQSKHSQELKQEDIEEGINLEEVISHHSQQSHHSQLPEEAHSENVHQLEEVVEDIAQEIENEIPDESK